MTRICVMSILVLVSLLPGMTGTVGAVPVGDFQVSAELRAVEPVVAMAPSGAFAVAWNGTDPDSALMFVRLYDAQGRVRGTPIVVNRVSRWRGSRPAIAMDASGNFVIAWHGSAAADTDGIYAQRFDADGNYLGGEFLVNAATGGEQLQPAIAMHPDGAFVVLWEEDPAVVLLSNPTLAAIDTEIELRRFNADGTALSGDLAPTAAYGAAVQALMQDDGSFVVVWEQDDGIFGARFDATTGEFRDLGNAGRISRDTDERQSTPALGFDQAGGFVVTWRDGAPGVIVVRRFLSDGSATGAPFTIGGLYSDYPNRDVAPRATFLADGVPALAWAYDGDPEWDDDNQVLLSILEPNNTLRVNQYRAALTYNRAAEYADIAASTAGSFVIVWGAQVMEEFCEGGSTVPYCYDIEVDRIYARLFYPTSYAVSAGTVGAVEGTTPPITFTVHRSGAVVGDQAVYYRFTGTATYGEDYVLTGAAALTPGQIGFAPGQTSAGVTIAILDDIRSEPRKTILFELFTDELDFLQEAGFPIAAISLVDDELSEVRLQQTDGSTRVVRDGAGDEISVALRSVPAAPVTVLLTPSSFELNLGAGWGATQSVVFAADASALEPQTVALYTMGGSQQAVLDGLMTVQLSARSNDPSYHGSAPRFTVDGEDRQSLPVEVIVPPGSGPGIINTYLPLVVR
jgi:hypothetical protein